MDKKGFSHIELTIAFLIFISVVLFAVYFLEIGKKASNSSKVLEDIKSRFYITLEEKLVQYSLALNEGGKIISIPLNVEDNMNCRVLSLNGQIFDCMISKNKIYFNTSSDKNYKIILSKDIRPSSVNYEESNEVIFTLGPKIERNIITMNKILDLNKSYYEKYEEIRKKLSGDKDFAFSIGNITAEKEVAGNSQIFASEDRKEILYENGEIYFEKILLKIW